MQLPVSLIDALTEYKQDLRKIGFHAKIERIFRKKAHCPASPHATCAIARLRTKDRTKTGQPRKSYKETFY